MAPSIVKRNAVLAAAGHEPALLQSLITRTVIATAIPEVAARFNVVALRLEHQRWSLAIVAELLFLMAFQFSTLTRVNPWLKTRRMEAE